MKLCKNCGNEKTFDNISCRYCSEFQKLQQSLASKRLNQFLAQGYLKACACGLIANVIYMNTYLCAKCHNEAL